MDFSILKLAGVSQQLLAEIMKVTPASVSYWVKGRPMTAKRAATLVKLLGIFRDAVEQGALPTNKESYADHAKYVKTLIIEALRRNPPQA